MGDPPVDDLSNRMQARGPGIDVHDLLDARGAIGCAEPRSALHEDHLDQLPGEGQVRSVPVRDTDDVEGGRDLPPAKSPCSWITTSGGAAAARGSNSCARAMPGSPK